MAHSAVPPLAVSRKPGFADTSLKNEAPSSGVSWPAVLAGAFAAAALSLILLALGTGIGLSSVSPWSNMGASASAIGIGAIVWLIVTQIIAATMGGYLAGRLRTKWVNIHTNEVYFRDTAHGFLVWAVGLVITAAFLASAATSMVGGGAQLGAITSGKATSAQSDGQASDPNKYFVDTLFRSDRPASETTDASIRAEAGSIFANALRQKDVPAPDKTYLGQLVAARTGLSQTDAEQRVSDVLSQARQAADTARKTVAHSLYWTFLALLIGAFCASFAATIGGKQRDHVVTI
jgi:hypothetical protein